MAPAAHTPCATASASHQLGSCQTTVSPGPMPCAWSSPATRRAASASSAQVTSWVSSMTATDDPSSKTLVSSNPGTTASVWNPALRYPMSNSSGIGAAAYSNVMWRTLPLLGETATMDPSTVIGVQDLFAQYAHRIDGRDFE